MAAKNEVRALALPLARVLRALGIDTRITHVKNKKKSNPPAGLILPVIPTPTTACAVPAVTVLACAVCFEKFSGQDEARQPLVLTTCGHSICRSCGDRLVASAAGAPTFPCPFCRKENRNLTRNFGLQDQLEMIDQLLPAPSVAFPCQGRHSELVDATVYCPECKRVLCASCSDAIHCVVEHEGIVPAAQRPPPELRCTRCPDKNLLSLICLAPACGKSLICAQCIALGAHRGHDYELASTAEVRHKGELEALLGRVAESVAAVEASAHATLAIEAELGDLVPAKGRNGTLMAAKTKINAHFDRLAADLQARRAVLLARVDEICEGCRASIDTHLAALGVYLSGAHAAREVTGNALAQTGQPFSGLFNDVKATLERILAAPLPTTHVPAISPVAVLWPGALDIANYGHVANELSPISSYAEDPDSTYAKENDDDCNESGSASDVGASSPRELDVRVRYVDSRDGGDRIDRHKRRAGKRLGKAARR